MAFRFVHAADIHLDSPLRSLAMRNADLADLIGNATRQAFVAIIDLCIEEQVDALLIAGDLYDGEQTSMKTARFLGDQFRRLDEAGIRTFVIRGNHDALSKITKELTLPDSVKLFSGRAEAIEVTGARRAVPIAVHGLSFSSPQAPESLLPKYRPPIEGAVNIAMMHTSLGGAEGHDVYAPCNPIDLAGSGHQYWALGHIHKRSVTLGASTIVMPGNPQGRDINESGAKSVTLVTVGDDRSIHLDERQTSIAQFERVSIDLDGVVDWAQVVSLTAEALRQARHHATSHQLVTRLAYTGRTELGWRLRRDVDLLQAEADDRASILRNCWVEKVELRCASPELSVKDDASPLIELGGMIAADILGSQGYKTNIARIFEELVTQLPPELRSILGDDPAEAQLRLEALSRDGAEDILARLQPAAPEREA